MSIVSKNYTGDGSTKIFSSDFKVLSENHIEVYVNDVLISKSDYDTINNAAVFASAPANGATVVVRVGTTPDDLLVSTTNIDTVAANITDINTLEDNLTDINTVADNISDVNTVADDIANVNTVANIDGIEGIVDNLTNITTVAGINAQVSTVAANADAVSTVGASITSVSTVSADIDNVNTVAGNTADIDTVAANDANITTVAGIDSDVTTVAGIDSDVTAVSTNNTNVTTVATNIANVNATGSDIANVNTVAGNTTNINTVAANDANITTVAGVSTNVTTVAGIASDVTAVAGIASDIQDVQNQLTEVQTVADDLNEAVSEIETVAASIANVDSVATNIAGVNTVGGSIANVNTVATNIADVNNFADTYSVGATEPTSPTIGDLWFDSSNSIMKVYDGNGFVNAGSSVNGTSSRNTYTATSGQTSFAAVYDAGYVDVYLNGIKLQETTDFTATDGANVVLTSGANVGDIVEIVAYGTFELADHYNKDVTDNLLDDKVDKVTSTDNAVVRFDGTTGQVQNSGVQVTDVGAIKATQNTSSNWEDGTFGYHDTVGTVIRGKDGSVFDLSLYDAGGSNIILSHSSVTDKISIGSDITLDSSGNVGIGTSSPQTKVHIKGSQPILTVQDTSASSANAQATLRLAESGASGAIDQYWDIKAVDGRLDIIDSWQEGGGTGVRATFLDSGGITFNGDTSTANALDDYEEGTWTPTAWISYGSGSLTTNSSYGTYVKIGNMVTVYFTLNITKSGSFNTGISGLPFTHSNVAGSGAYGTARENSTGDLYGIEGLSSAITVLRRYNNSVLPDGTYNVSGSYTMRITN